MVLFHLNDELDICMSAVAGDELIHLVLPIYYLIVGIKLADSIARPSRSFINRLD